jgi:hypothetical protein
MSQEEICLCQQWHLWLVPGTLSSVIICWIAKKEMPWSWISSLVVIIHLCSMVGIKKKLPDVISTAVYRTVRSLRGVNDGRTTRIFFYTKMFTVRRGPSFAPPPSSSIIIHHHHHHHHHHHRQTDSQKIPRD